MLSLTEEYLILEPSQCPCGRPLPLGPSDGLPMFWRLATDFFNISSRSPSFLAVCQFCAMHEPVHKTVGYDERMRRRAARAS